MSENVVNEVLSIGRFGLLVDFPPTGANVNTVPYIATYTAENISDWKSLRDPTTGKRYLCRVVLKDDYDDDDEDVNDDAEVRLELIINDDGHYEVKRWISTTAQKKGKDQQWMLKEQTVPTINGKPLDRIPFVFINPYDLRPEVTKPPFLDLVDVRHRALPELGRPRACPLSDSPTYSLGLGRLDGEEHPESHRVRCLLGPP